MEYGAGTLPLAIAHRGGAGLARENTMAAFDRSYALGVRYLETDVRLTRDGVPVLVHDSTLRRCFGRREAVCELHSRELPDEVPTLEAALRCFEGACFTIDIKDSAAVTAVAQVLRRTRASARVCIAGAWDGTLDGLAKSVGPDLSVAMGWHSLCRLITSSHSRLPLIRRGCPRYAHVPFRLGRLPIFVDRLMERAHAVGVRVIVWTVDDPPTMRRLLDAGVDGIITDRPDLLREVLVSRNVWSPPARRHEPAPPAPLAPPRMPRIPR